MSILRDLRPDLAETSRMSSQKNTRPFLSDIQDLRRRAREHIRQGAVTPSYTADLPTAIRILNEALATELVCVLRYKNHYFTASGMHSHAVAEEFLEHAQDELRHADSIAARIRQLGGNPEMDPSGLATRSHAEYQEGETLVELITEDLVAERIAIESYREMVDWFSGHDPTTRRLLERILAQEEEHADDLAELLLAIDPRKKSDQAA